MQIAPKDGSKANTLPLQRTFAQACYLAALRDRRCREVQDYEVAIYLAHGTFSKLACLDGALRSRVN